MYTHLWVGLRNASWTYVSMVCLYKLCVLIFMLCCICACLKHARTLHCTCVWWGTSFSQWHLGDWRWWRNSFNQWPLRGWTRLAHDFGYPEKAAACPALPSLLQAPPLEVGPPMLVLWVFCSSHFYHLLLLTVSRSRASVGVKWVPLPDSHCRMYVLSFILNPCSLFVSHELFTGRKLYGCILWTWYLCKIQTDICSTQNHKDSEK